MADRDLSRYRIMARYVLNLYTPMYGGCNPNYCGATLNRWKIRNHRKTFLYFSFSVEVGFLIQSLEQNWGHWDRFLIDTKLSILEDSLTRQPYADLTHISPRCYTPADYRWPQRGQTNPWRGYAGAYGSLVLLRLITSLCFSPVFENVLNIAKNVYTCTNIFVGSSTFDGITNMDENVITLWNTGSGFEGRFIVLHRAYNSWCILLMIILLVLFYSRITFWNC